MVGGLSSQVENAAGISQNGHDMESSTTATGTTSSGDDSGFSKHTFEPPQAAEDFGVLEVASNGDLVVGEGFWTIFCKEVCTNSTLVVFLYSHGEGGYFLMTCELLQIAEGVSGGRHF
jgi:hypothetical protein